MTAEPFLQRKRNNGANAMQNVHMARNSKNSRIGGDASTTPVNQRPKTTLMAKITAAFFLYW
jgi:hypothetical protein